MVDVIDRTVLAALSDSVGAEFVAELIDTFREEAPGMFAELRQTLSKSDVDSFRRAAHSLKTNANTFGANQLAELARELEIGARTNGLPGVRKLEALEEAYQAALAELMAYKVALIKKGSIL